MALSGMFFYWLSYLVDACYRIYYHYFQKHLQQSITPASESLLYWSATATAKKIRERKWTCETIVQTYIDRIKEVNARLNALIENRFELALEEARKLDEDIRNGVITEEIFDKKPFLGVPFTSKESTHCKGMQITFGLIGRVGMRAEDDADVIKFMKEAGGILLGTTNIPQLNMWWETHNPVHGVTRNPYDRTKCVGGSSGGEASIIAACGSPIGVATDIGGSIRVPAYMCGLFGHKCSNKLSSTKGLTFRNGSEAETTMVTVGPLVRYAEDLLPGIKVMLGPAHTKLNLDEPVDITKLKYFWIDEIGDPLCPPPRKEIMQVMASIVDHFKDNVGTTEQIEVPHMQYGNKLYRYWLGKEGANFKLDLTNRKHEASAFKELFMYLFSDKSEFHFAAILYLLNNAVMKTVDEEWALKITAEMKEDLLLKLGTNGVLFFHSMPAEAHHHHASYLRPFNIIYTAIFNLLKLPVTQVPMGLNKNGLPLGIQVVSAPGNDRLCVAVAKELEQRFGGYVPPFPEPDFNST